MNKSPNHVLKWELQDILNFSANLLKEEKLNKQKADIKEFLSNVFNAEVFLWLDNTILPLPDVEDDSLFITDNLSPLMEESIKKRDCILKENQRKKTVSFPLIFKEKVLGAIQVDFINEISAKELESSLFRVFGNQVSTIIFLSRQERIKEWRNKQIDLVRTVSARIFQEHDESNIFNHVVNLVHSTFHYYFVAIYIFDVEKQKLIFKSSAGEDVTNDNDFKDIFKNGIPVGKGMIGHCAKNQQSLLAENVKTDKRFHSVSGLPQTLSEICMPLKIDNKFIGVMDVQSNFENGFHQNDILILEILADSIAIAVENALLLKDVTEKASQIQIVSDISHAISSILDLDKLLFEIVHILKDRFDFPDVKFFTIDKEMNRAVFMVGTGENSEELKKQGIWFDINSHKGIVAWVARNNKAYIANDTSDDDLYLPLDLILDDAKSEIAVPISFSGKVLGILDIQSFTKNAFTENHKKILTLIARDVAISLQNALIYRSERWRRKVAESFHAIANIFTRDFSLEEIYREVLKILNENFPCAAGAIWTLKDNQTFCISELIGIPKEDYDSCVELKSGELINRAISNEEAIIRSQDDGMDPLGKFLNFRKNYSAIIVPIKTGDQKLGVIELIHELPNRYNDETREVLETFAGYTSVAIQNLGLFTASREQALMATALLLVSETAESIDAIDNLFASILKLLNFVIGIKKTIIYQKTYTDSFEIVDHTGLETEELKFFESFPSTFDGILNFTKMIGLQSGEYQSLDLSSSDDKNITENWIAIPLKTQDKLYGVLLVQLEKFKSERDFLQGSGAKHLDVITAIARQTAIAAENINYRKSEQTEAYVTAVLLQVAEIIVSSSDISEILDKIIGIMPILIGVECTIFLLWDKNREVFVVEKKFSGKWKEKINKLGDFLNAEDYSPLSKMIEEKNPVFVSLEYLDPDEWFGKKNYTILPTKNALIESVQNVQILYPILDKEDFYGVMLVADSIEQIEYREKRMDIFNGIAQQLSVVFQNELLKEEMVGREKLQQEFKLAREIQETFLPDSLPQLDTWEVSVRWRPVRQVGGDFYDFIELPENRWGFVIADVSDKGIPAALYMTVTRTLIHATARENLTPAETLEKVNRLLLESSPEGLFITAFYGILEGSSGDFLYANSGHNQPLVIRKSKNEIEILEKGGMPLGVTTDNKIEDRSVHINKDETLFLYTDGITEAQSLDGKLYGMNRLQSFLLKESHANMNRLLDALDKNIMVFQKGFPPSDDFTVIALQRVN